MRHVRSLHVLELLIFLFLQVKHRSRWVSLVIRQCWRVKTYLYIVWSMEFQVRKLHDGKRIRRPSLKRKHNFLWKFSLSLSLFHKEDLFVYSFIYPFTHVHSCIIFRHHYSISHFKSIRISSPNFSRQYMNKSDFKLICPTKSWGWNKCFFRQNKKKRKYLWVTKIMSNKNVRLHRFQRLTRTKVLWWKQAGLLSTDLFYSPFYLLYVSTNSIFPRLYCLRYP